MINIDPEYLTIEETAKRWDCTAKDVLNYGSRGLLCICALLTGNNDKHSFYRFDPYALREFELGKSQKIESFTRKEQTGQYWCRCPGRPGDNIKLLHDLHGMSFKQACDVLDIEASFIETIKFTDLVIQMIHIRQFEEKYMGDSDEQDPQHSHSYPRGLYIANECGKAIYGDQGEKIDPSLLEQNHKKTIILPWLEKHYPKLDSTTKERVATLVHRRKTNAEPNSKFSRELTIANKCWESLYGNKPKSKPKKGHIIQIFSWLKSYDQEILSKKARNRIATVVNPNPKGGSPRIE